MEDEEAVAALEMMVGEDFFIMLHLTMFLPTIQVSTAKYIPIDFS